MINQIVYNGVKIVVSSLTMGCTPLFQEDCTVAYRYTITAQGIVDTKGDSTEFRHNLAKPGGELSLYSQWGGVLEAKCVNGGPRIAIYSCKPIDHSTLAEVEVALNVTVSAKKPKHDDGDKLSRQQWYMRHGCDGGQFAGEGK